jgi:hypothetical protein
MPNATIPKPLGHRILEPWSTPVIVDEVFGCRRSADAELYRNDKQPNFNVAASVIKRKAYTTQESALDSVKAEA